MHVRSLRWGVHMTLERWGSWTQCAHFFSHGTTGLVDEANVNTRTARSNGEDRCRANGSLATKWDTKLSFQPNHRGLDTPSPC